MKYLRLESLDRCIFNHVTIRGLCLLQTSQWFNAVISITHGSRNETYLFVCYVCCVVCKRVIPVLEYDIDNIFINKNTVLLYFIENYKQTSSINPFGAVRLDSVPLGYKKDSNFKAEGTRSHCGLLTICLPLSNQPRSLVLIKNLLLRTHCPEESISSICILVGLNAGCSANF